MPTIAKNYYNILGPLQRPHAMPVQAVVA